MVHSENPEMKSGQKYWRSLEDLANTPEFAEKLRREFPQGASELEVVLPVDRRRFLSIMGASMALAGVVSGCIRKPTEKILPYSMRPEEIIEGKALYYASAMYVGSSVMGVLVESHEGRPTKIEGNPQHPMSFGATNHWAQANILEMYDPDRAQFVLNQGEKSNWESFKKFSSSHFETQRANGGKGLALLIDSLPSPTLRELLADFRRSYPQARLFQFDPAVSEQRNKALGIIGQGNTTPVYELDKAEVVLALDSDCLGFEGDGVRNARLFMSRRRMTSEQSHMNRLYAVEPAFTTTGGTADNRLSLRSSQMGEFLLILASELGRLGVQIPAAVEAKARAVGRGGVSYAKWIAALASDLANNRGKSAVIIGDGQPEWVHALGFAVNEGLGNVGTTVVLVPDAGAPQVESLPQLTESLRAAQIQTLIILGGNPVYAAPADLNFAEALKQATTTLHLSYYPDETSRLCTWHVPRSHNLEAWGDLRAADGTVSIRQPLIAPLFESLSEIEFVAHVVAAKSERGYDLVKNTWQTRTSMGAGFERAWKRWLHDGIVSEGKPPRNPTPFTWSGLESLMAGVVAAPAVSPDNLEVRFALDPSVLDGRFANLAWLQELPDPVSKLTWDNAALLSPKTAKALGVVSEDVVELSYQGRYLKIPVFEVPGIADNTLILPLGYGREFGRVAIGAGANVTAVRTSKAMTFDSGAKLTKTGTILALASTQEHGSMEGRPIVRETSLAEYKKAPNFTDKFELMVKEKQKTFLWTRPNPISGQQWGMSIDLTTCTGCNACTVACQAENNIPIVGKKEILNGRELHWIRIDRYFTASVDDPQVVYQPMACVHCENAPCESVCPVGATIHSPEGLNDMAYNRCIGTRYCANNCPYKVRRFNFFNYPKENDEQNPLLAMQKNPNVTVRFRGVMEKCTYCVQRINEAKIEAKREGNGVVPDGRIVTACQQVCPTESIVFGDINNPDSKVSRLKRQNREYGVLGELNTQPRTTYLAKIRNPHPELV